MKIHKILIFLFLLTGCSHYDKLIVYDKKHTIIKSNLLRYDGFYYSNTVLPMNDEECPDKTLPLFLYADGTAYTSGQFCNKDSIMAFYGRIREFPRFNWGSFKFEGKEITVEFYWPNSSTRTYERYQMKGIVRKDTIIFNTYINRDFISKPINSMYYFNAFKIKPDSSQSFLKTNYRFNK